MKNEVIRELSTKELAERLEEERNSLTRMRLLHAISPLDNPHKISESRRSIARMITELNKRSKTQA